MIDFAADIKSKHSIANILLQDNISTYMNELYERHKVEIKSYTLPDGETRTAYVIDSTLTLSILPDGTIFFNRLQRAIQRALPEHAFYRYAF